MNWYCVNIVWTTYTEKKSCINTTLIYEDHCLLGVTTLLCLDTDQFPEGPSAATHKAFKGWLEFSTHLSTLDSCQECRGRMSRPGLEHNKVQTARRNDKGEGSVFFSRDFLFLVTYLVLWYACSGWSKTKVHIQKREESGRMNKTKLKQTCISWISQKTCETRDRIHLWSADVLKTKVHSTFMMVRSRPHCSIDSTSFCLKKMEFQTLVFVRKRWALKFPKTEAQRGFPVPPQEPEEKYKDLMEKQNWLDLFGQCEILLTWF